MSCGNILAWWLVSTHSRPKAAAHWAFLRLFFRVCFNTQPPEGGCLKGRPASNMTPVSTHSRPKAAAPGVQDLQAANPVSTHSRPKAAASLPKEFSGSKMFQHTAARRRLRQPTLSTPANISFNTQPPEGGCDWLTYTFQIDPVSTHSRPKAAAHQFHIFSFRFPVSTHSRPKAAAWEVDLNFGGKWFQHTAARRRLHRAANRAAKAKEFQHTAARRRLHLPYCFKHCIIAFQHTAARRRLPIRLQSASKDFRFQHTAARRRLHHARMFPQDKKMFQHTAARRRLHVLIKSGCNTKSFNTQPPEGGCRQARCRD